MNDQGPSSPPNSAPTRVALFNPIIAHYREALLRELRANRRCQFFLFADVQDATWHIPALDLSADGQFCRTRCRRIGRFTWQSGVVAAAFGNYDAYIFLGSVEWPASWLGALIARARGKRVLFWTHGWLRHETFFKRVIKNTMFKLAHGLLLYSDRAKQIGSAYGFDPATLHVMYNSLDVDVQQTLVAAITPDARAQLRTELFGECTVPVVIGSARLTTAKRFDLLIRALGILKRRGKSVHLLLVGDGPERDRLETLAKDQQIRIAFVGACYEEGRLAQLFTCATVTVSPGNIGLTCMHSLGYGVPVITHDDPNQQGPEWEAIEPGITGGLFVRENVDSLADAVENWTRSTWPTAATHQQCLASIRARYHPAKQCQAIERAIVAEPPLTGIETVSASQSRSSLECLDRQRLVHGAAVITNERAGHLPPRRL